LVECLERLEDLVGVSRADLDALLAQVLAQRREPVGGVDELDLALAAIFLAVGEHPHVRGDTGVVEHLQRQCDDRLKPVVLYDPPADVALALPGIAGESPRVWWRL